MNKLGLTFKSFIPLLVVLALLVSPIVGVARADDEPPAAPEAVTEAPAAETSALVTTDAPPSEPAQEEATVDSAQTGSTLETVTEAASELVAEVPMEVTETVEVAEASEAALTETAPVETPAEVIAAVAEIGNEVVVLDAAGGALPLATEEAAAIIVHGDPMWCPAGTLPGGTGCTASFSAFTGAGGLLQELQTNSAAYSGDGTIYISYDYDSALETSDIFLDGNVFTSLGGLTLQGGWDFNTNALEADLNGDPDSFIGGLSVGVINWTSDVTINNLTIFGGLGSGTGLQVTTTGDISVDNTQVQLFDGTGASLVNNDGEGDVSVTNSSFTHNTGDGLRVETAGNITVDNIFTSLNNNDGADLRAFGPECDTPEACAAGGNISVSNSIFQLNGLMTGVDAGNGGLAAQATQDIYLTDVRADTNGGNGVDLHSGALLSVVIDGGEFNNNGDNGLEVDTNGNITLNNVVANLNVNNGADLGSDNQSGNNTINISNSAFNQNGQDVFDESDPEFTICTSDFVCNGIYAGIEGGNISLFNVTASENYNNGAVLISSFSCEDEEDCIEPPSGSLLISFSNFTGNGLNAGLEDECNEEQPSGVGFGIGLACEGVLLAADDNGAVSLDCNTFAMAQNYGAELFIENDGSVTLNGNIFVSNGLGDVVVREGNGPEVEVTEGGALCAPAAADAGLDPTTAAARTTLLDCHFAPEGATAFETEAQVKRLYDLPGPLMISCFPDGSVTFWHVVDGVGVRMSGYAAPDWETAIGADGFVFDQIDPDGFRTIFTLLSNAAALGLPELGSEGDWYQVQFFGPDGEPLVNAYLPLRR